MACWNNNDLHTGRYVKYITGFVMPYMFASTNNNFKRFLNNFLLTFKSASYIDFTFKSTNVMTFLFQ